jgi:phenylalanyl-tRNA synthetase beta chain
MRLPVEWIREYAPIEAGPEEIAERLTMAGLEVEETAESDLGAVLDIKVTPNRGDCLSVVGVARELAAAHNVPLKPLPVEATSDAGGADLVKVTIEDPELCPRYAARVIRNVKVGPAPQWIQDRVTAAGMRPINNIVDVTNYVMLETGQPLHAFDYEKVRDRHIVVRRATEGETLTTLDGVERTLTSEMLVIADPSGPVALAGVMGGADSEMSEDTTTVLLESAHFHPRAPRRTARALDMRTEASYRFERTVDPAGAAAAADRACQLIAQIGAGEPAPGIVDMQPIPPVTRVVTVRAARVAAMLGYDVGASRVVDALTRLGFQVDGGPAEAMRVRIPSWRQDIVREIDLVEEVGRVLGYEHIPETLPKGETTQGGDSEWSRFAERVREALAGAGLWEIVGHSLRPDSLLDAADAGADRRTIRKPLADLTGLRQSVLPGLVDVLERNARRGQSPLAFFEVGRVFRGERENTEIGGILAGPLSSPFWQKDGRGQTADFYTARGVVERLLAALRAADVRFEPVADPRFHPGRAATVLAGHQAVGVVGELHPRHTANLSTRERVLAFTLDFEALQDLSARAAAFEQPSAFPSVARDLAPRVSRQVPFGTIQESVRALGIGILEAFALRDVYEGAPLPEGTCSLTLSFTFRAPERTLTDEEVNDALARIRTALEQSAGATFAA